MHEIINKIVQQNQSLFGTNPKIDKINIGFTNTIYNINDLYIVKICTDEDNEKEFKKEIDFYNSNKNNNLIPKLYCSSINKKDDSKDIVYTYKTVAEKDDKYSISAYLPKVNINAYYADKINAQISQDYEDTINDIIDNTKEDTDYSVTYKAYLNGDLLSILIKENIHKGKSTQSSKIKTYNYNLNNNTEVGIMDIVEAKNYKQKDIQKEIDTEIEALNKKDEEIKTQYSEVKLRDLNNSMYKIENTENFIINDQGYLYLIYAYGNTEDTNKIDTIIFE